jgi:prepilin-type N-terminal cleavage/methylation domain-containing protein
MFFLDFEKNKAFTLIELMVAITIFFVMLGAAYAPYQYYMNKAKVRNTMKEISSSLYEARNMAVNGTTSGSNISI